jgi:prepilin-type N-terminal cleavage/methylation domain-containing protein
MKNTLFKKGFTVLEFLIVVAIMAILIGLILVGLTAARKNSRDQSRVSNVQNIAVGLAQFYDICRVYPVSLDSTTVYPCLDNKTFASLVPDIEKFAFNTGGEYFYASLADPIEADVCTSMHVGVLLETSDASYKATKSKAPAASALCNGSSPDFDGTPTTMFDIKK